MSTKKGLIGILTGGGDVPGLNPAIRAVTIRALREGYKVVGIRHGWLGAISILRDEHADNSEHFQILTEEIVNRAARTGGTFLHTSRTNPSAVKKEEVPEELRATFDQDKNDLTSEVIKNLDWLGIDYCIGFSTCVSRTIELSNRLRTSAGSHERFLVMEVFGRYAGFTAMLPTMAGAANRCVIPEYKFDMEHLTELLCYDRAHHPSKYSVVIVSEGAMFEGGEMVFSDRTTDAFGHLKLGGIGDLVSAELKDRSAKYNKGKPIQTINQRLGYMVRGGDPDAIDSIVPMAYGNLALDLILHGHHGRLVVLKNGRYDNMPIEAVTSSKKTVNVERYYNKERLRPLYTEFEMQPLFIMASD